MADVLGARTFMAFTTQRLSVAVQYSAAQEVAEALGLSVAADPRAAPYALEGRRGACRRGGPRGAGASSQGPRPAMRLLCTALRV